MTHKELVREYIGKDFDSSVLESWYTGLMEIDTELDDLAIYLGQAFVKGEISFDTANGILNQLMPLRGFDEAPETFWKFYSGFEDFEVIDHPSAEAKIKIIEILSELNAT